MNSKIEEERKQFMEDNEIANKIYSDIVDILVDKELKHVRMALNKIEFNLFCVTDDE